MLADKSSAVTVLTQNFREHPSAFRNLPAVSRVAVTLLDNHSGPGRMMIASGQQRGARRRAERGGVAPRIAQTHFRQSIHIRRGNLSTKSAPLSEASVIDQND